MSTTAPSALKFSSTPTYFAYLLPKPPGCCFCPLWYVSRQVVAGWPSDPGHFHCSPEGLSWEAPATDLLALICLLSPFLTVHHQLYRSHLFGSLEWEHNIWLEACDGNLFQKFELSLIFAVLRIAVPPSFLPAFSPGPRETFGLGVDGHPPTLLFQSIDQLRQYLIVTSSEPPVGQTYLTVQDVFQVCWFSTKHTARILCHLSTCGGFMLLASH